MYKTIAILMLAVIVSSCASFSNKALRPIKMENKNIKLMDFQGVYSVNELISYTGKGEKKDTTYTSSYNRLYHYLNLTDVMYDSTVQYTVKVERLSSKKLSLILNRDDDAIHRVEIEGKIRGGFFYFKEKNVDCWGIPFLIGGCQSEKVRLGLTKENALIVNYAHNTAGALLFILGDSRGYNDVITLKKEHYEN